MGPPLEMESKLDTIGRPPCQNKSEALRFRGHSAILKRLIRLTFRRSPYTLDAFGNIDSKYRFIILAAKRAKQLLRGAKPKIHGKSRNPIRIAQAEARKGLIEYELIPTRMA